MSKAALTAMTKSLAIEYGRKSLRVNVVFEVVAALLSPYRTGTDMLIDSGMRRELFMSERDLRTPSCSTACIDAADELNRGCFCTTLNRDQLHSILQADDINKSLIEQYPQLFSNTSVFISPNDALKIRCIIDAITRIVTLPEYAQEVLAYAPCIAAYDPGTAGVFMGYDFHLNHNGPQLIEINTNAGGAFLNAALVNAQTECCRTASQVFEQSKHQFDEQFIAMFLNEWKLQRGESTLSTIAIMDEKPSEQFLYPEFKMAQRLFERFGIRAFIVDPNELKLINQSLCYHEHKIDLIYNRLTDFSLAKPQHQALRHAYEENSVVLTPNPHHHAFFANKRNLVILSDQPHLKEMGADIQDIAILHAGIPHTQRVTENNAETLWRTRKQLFFKPAVGFGSRAAYRGDKITQRVWHDILAGDYVAQQIVMPSERGLLVDAQKTSLKMDIRAYVYDGNIQLMAARLYQGQTTNFRTQGGGFAPIFIAK